MTDTVAQPARAVSRVGQFTSVITIRLRQPAKRRRAELALLAFAIGIVELAFCLVGFGVNGTIDAGICLAEAGVGVLAVLLHATLRVTARDADPLLVPIAYALTGIGTAEIWRLDLAHHRTGFSQFAEKQLLWTAIALVLAIATLVAFRNYRVLQRFRYLAMLLGLLLVVAPMLPGIGRTVNGAHLWIGLGGFVMQPGEFGKIALAVFFAGYLVTARDSLSIVGRKLLWMRFPRARDLGPILVVWVLAMLVLVLQRDLGTSLLYFGLFLVMIYVATARLSWVLIGLALFAGGAFAAASALGYVQGRFDAWLNAFDPRNYNAVGGSYQLVQGLFGLANGGLAGTGFGLGRPQIVPVAESDYIIASLGEELGLIGVFAILSLLLLLVSRGFHIGFTGQDDFGRMLAVGLSFVIGLQVFIVVGGVTRVIPLTGLTTPFLAAGGSSLMANWLVVALLARLSDGVPAGPKAVTLG